ncbi:MAG: CHC2 zinc finger domain-containing protein [Opitutaceae bacterium]
MNKNSGRTWINFKELRQKLKFEDVLRHYDIEVRRKGDQHQGPCPLPGHRGRKSAPSFSANLERGIFQCFGCGAKGNALEFAGLMEGVNLEDGNALRKVAVKLQQAFFPEGASTHTKGKSALPSRPIDEPKSLPVVVNASLDFELKHLEHVHPYLTGRGFEHRTTVHFGVGFCSRGLLKDRIAIPLHDQDGKLVGYAGRVIDDGAVSAETPRYLFPSERVRDGVRHVFDRSLFLYNGFRIKAPCDDLVIVHGFTSVWWLRQNGFGNVVALMDGRCSERQAELIVSLVKPTGRVLVMTGRNAPGNELAQSILIQVCTHRSVRQVALEQNQQPTDMTGEQLKARFSV